MSIHDMPEGMKSEFLDAFRAEFGFGEMTATANDDAAAMLKAAAWAWQASSKSLAKDLESHNRMLLAAACDIGAIGEALGADMDDDGSAIEGLAQELSKDAERLDFLQSLARSSYTGASIVKGEAKKSLEVMWFHRRAGAQPSLREAIDAAKELGQ